MMKNIALFLLTLVLMTACMRQALIAYEHELNNLPTPPLEFLQSECERGEERACEAYLDRRFEEEYGVKND